jgi:arsenite methyltransferase
VSEVMRYDEAAARRQDMVYLTPDVVAQRYGQLRILEPRAGERIVDIGCGTGLFVADLAQTVGPSGKVLGLDVSPDVLALARRRCADWPWATCELGDAATLSRHEVGSLLAP